MVQRHLEETEQVIKRLQSIGSTHGFQTEREYKVKYNDDSRFAILDAIWIKDKTVQRAFEIESGPRSPRHRYKGSLLNILTASEFRGGALIFLSKGSFKGIEELAREINRVENYIHWFEEHGISKPGSLKVLSAAKIESSNLL